MYEAGITLRFNAHHQLHGDFGPARDIHGHDYRLDVSVLGPALNADGVLIDIMVLQSACNTLIEVLEGKNLDEVPALAGLNTTMEGLSGRIHAILNSELPRLPGGTLRIRVWESPDSWGAYEAQLR